MNYKFFLNGIKNIILNPVKTWDSIDPEDKSTRLLRDSYLFPLIILVSLSAIAGSFIFIHTELSPVFSILEGIKCFFLLFITIYSTAALFGEITFPLDLGKDFSISFRIIVYSITPFMLCQILSRLFESLLFVNIIGLYGFYIFWTGAERMFLIPRYKKMPLLIATFVMLSGIYIATDFLLTKLTERLYFTFFT